VVQVWRDNRSAAPEIELVEDMRDDLLFGDRVQVRTDDVDGVPSAADLLGPCPDGTTVYACGPAPMLTALRARLAGRDEVELHFERFAAPPVVDGAPFTVTVASTGQSLDVGAEETLLGALTRAGVPAPYSCQQGFCGTCRTRIVAGQFLTGGATLLSVAEIADGWVLACQTLPREDLEFSFAALPHIDFSTSLPRAQGNIQGD
jgi:ferredoxin